MKLYITINGDPLNTYTTLDPCGGIGKIVQDFHNLDNVCQPNELTELLAPEILDFIHPSVFENTVKHYVSKLRHGGRIILGGTDLHDIAKKIMKSELTIQEANVYLYGGQLNWTTKCAAYSMYEIIDFLRGLGLKIIQQKCDDVKFVVTAERE